MSVDTPVWGFVWLGVCLAGNSIHGITVNLKNVMISAGILNAVITQH